MSVSGGDVVDIRGGYLPKAYGMGHPIVADRAYGSFLVDENGRTYIDFAGGIGTANVGHCAPTVVEAVRDQASRLIHTGPVAANRRYIELARRLAAKRGSEADYQVLFVNSGGEATETAIKLARHATGRAAVIAFDHGFHGRTLLCASVTGKTHPYKLQPGAMAPEIHHAPYPNLLRPPVGVDPKRLVDHVIATLDEMLITRVAVENVAAVLVEAIQGEGGVIVPPADFIPRLAEWCSKNSILLIADEVQTGYGRTGKFFAYEHSGISPDVVMVAKAIADGLPLAAVIARRDLWDRVVQGDIGGTYCGNPVACAAGLAVLDMFEDGTLLARAEAIGEQFRHRLAGLAGHRAVAQVRGIGAMWAVELVEDRTTLIPDRALAAEVIKAAREQGLLTIATGPYQNIVRMLPPLVTSEETVNDAADILVAAVNAVGA